MDTPLPTSHALPGPTLTRQRRQRAEILASVDAGHLHRAADLAHEHLAEVPNDRAVLLAVVTALERCSDARIRRRVAEFAPIEPPTPQVCVTDTGDLRRCR
ncbi:MAG TPA: hypothetical protein VFV63_04885 [Ilumatobacteraceae bacterium]|nr:hypothetical protein [Ilumatobacteraceae bacterium]